jgi:peptidoglycan/LPS O-acetylase OafA/YrhL
MGLDFPLPADPNIRKFKHKQPNGTDWRINWSLSIGIRRLDPYHFGICVPDSCSHSDVRELLNSAYVRNLTYPLSARVIASESRNDPFTMTVRQVIASLIIMASLSLGSLSAALNYLCPHSHISKVLKPFDVYENLVKLFSPVRHPDSMAVISNTYRSGYLLCGSLVHNFIAINLSTLFQRLEASSSLWQEWEPISTYTVYPVANALPSLFTTHMVATGCFVVVSWIPLMVKERISFLRFVVERIVRTLPVVAVYLLFTQTLPMIRFGGPLMKHVQQSYADVCWKNGWKELLFINNYADVRETCLPVAWFISAEFQLYLMSFIILLLISKYPQHSVKIVTAVIVFGILVTGMKFKRDRLSVTLDARLITLGDGVRTIAAKTYNTVYYIGPYAIGMMLGLVLCKQRGIPHPVGYRNTIIINLLVAVAIYLPWFMHEEDENNELRFRFCQIPGTELLYVSITRSMTAAVAALYFYALFNSRHPVILWFSGTRLAAIFSRMLLSFFMIHVMVIVLMISSHEDSSFSVTQSVKEFLFMIAASFVPSCVMYAFVEEPFAQIHSHYLRKRIAGGEATKQKDVNENTVLEAARTVKKKG